jgi:hypothetical protein
VFRAEKGPLVKPMIALVIAVAVVAALLKLVSWWGYKPVRWNGVCTVW